MSLGKMFWVLCTLRQVLSSKARESYPTGWQTAKLTEGASSALVFLSLSLFSHGALIFLSNTLMPLPTLAANIVALLAEMLENISVWSVIRDHDLHSGVPIQVTRG